MLRGKQHLFMFPKLLNRTLVCLLALACSFHAFAEEGNEKPEDKEEAAAEAEAAKFLEGLKWTKGPGTAQIDSIAKINVPEGFMFTDGKGTQKLMERMGNLTSGTEVGFLSPTSMVWFVVFRFSDDGYVKDDEKDKLDAKAMIRSIKEGTEAANEERRSRGWPTMTVVGWEKEPHYDNVTKNLEWAVRGESEGQQVVNYNSRILGRKGVMEAKLICEPEELATTLPEFKSLLAGYEYKEGQRYAEFREGDKVAQYGLAALITGGAVAVAAKTGLLAGLVLFLKKGWKVVVFGLVALGTMIKKIFSRGDSRE